MRFRGAVNCTERREWPRKSALAMLTVEQLHGCSIASASRSCVAHQRDYMRASRRNATIPAQKVALNGNAAPVPDSNRAMLQPPATAELIASQQELDETHSTIESMRSE